MEGPLFCRGFKVGVLENMFHRSTPHEVRHVSSRPYAFLMINIELDNVNNATHRPSIWILIRKKDKLIRGGDNLIMKKAI